MNELNPRMADLVGFLTENMPRIERTMLALDAELTRLAEEMAADVEAFVNDYLDDETWRP